VGGQKQVGPGGGAAAAAPLMSAVGKTATLAGRVAFPDGSPARDAWLTAEKDGTTENARVEPDGSFRFETLAPGTYRVTAQTGWGPEASQATVEARTGGEGVRISLLA